MAITSTDVQTLQSCAEGVMNRADHHAGQAKAIALSLLGGMIWRAEAGSIKIKQYDGGLANVLWFTVKGRQYALANKHYEEKIEIRDRTQSGPALYSFHNQTPVQNAEAVFRSL
jgi:Integron cassette protein VCH_CASS1 chain